MLLTGAQASAAAREQLHWDGSDPRDVHLFAGLDFRAASYTYTPPLRRGKELFQKCKSEVMKLTRRPFGIFRQNFWNKKKRF